MSNTTTRGRAAASPLVRAGELGLMLAALALAGSLAVTDARASHGGAPAFAASGFVYTANEFGNSVSRIDLESGLVETVAVPASVHNVQLTADGSRLLAVGIPDEGMAADMEGMGGMEDGAGVLLVFDPASFSAGPTAQIEVGMHPAHVIADPSGRTAFVTNSEDNNVSVVDLASGIVTGVIPTGKFPHGFRMSPDGSVIYAADVQDDSVSVLDPLGRTEIARIPVGKAPVQVGFTPDGKRVFVSLRDENAVAAIDTATRAVLDRIAVGRGPIQVYATPDGRFVLVANQGTEADPDDTVSVIDTAAGKVVKTIRTGPGAHGVVVSTDGTLAFISNIYDNTVSVIDTASWTLLGNVQVGEGPNGISYGS